MYKNKICIEVEKVVIFLLRKNFSNLKFKVRSWEKEGVVGLCNF